MATASTLCTGPIAGAVSIGKGRVLVSVQGDGVSCYDISTQKSVLSWALGGTDQEFSSAAVYDYASNNCYAPVRPRGSGHAAKATSSVLAWSADDTAGSITQLAHPLHLPALLRLFPMSSTPEGEEEEKAAAEAEERAATEVDGSGERQGGALAVYAIGGAALCSSTEVVSEWEEARGQHTLAASYQEGALVLVHSDPRSGQISASVCRVKGGKLESEPAVQLLPPNASCRAVAAASTSERTSVLWSDGTVAVYLVPGDKKRLHRGPEQTGSTRQALVQRRLAGYRLPAGKQKGGSGGGSKKRGAATDVDAAAGGVSMVAVGEKQVAVVGWAHDSEGTLVLRLVVLETSAGCVQLAQDFTAADVGLAVLDPTKTVQVDSLGAGSNKLAVSVGSAVLVVSCHELKPATLANLLGALAVDKALAVMRHGGGGAAALLAPTAAPPLLGSTAAVNPAALAAARVLHADDLAALSSPFGGAARAIDHRLVLEEPTEPGQWLVPAKEIIWKVREEEADQKIAAEERRVWQEVQHPAAAAAALGSDEAMQQLLAPLLELRRSTGLALSGRLVCQLIMLAAEHRHWGAVAAILAVQHPGMLRDVPGLAAAAADAGQFAALERLLYGCNEASAPEVSALLQVLLSPASSAAAEGGRQARHEAAVAAAAAAAEAAQQAAAGMLAPQQQQDQQPPALQQQQQHGRHEAAGQQPPGPAPKPGRRRRRRRGAADGGGDSDGEDPAAAADPGAAEQQQHAGAAAAEQQQAAAELPPPAAHLAPGAREGAVAACCRAAVEGFTPTDSCLHPLLVLRFSSALLREVLRTLGGAQAVQLLRYLLGLLRNHTTLVGGRAAGWQPPLQLPRGVALPRLEQALDWINAILDSNLVRLSHEPEANPMLGELQQLAELQIASTKPLLPLSGVVKHLLQQRPLPRSAARTADYSMQWLDLRIQSDQQQQQQQQQQQ